LEKRLYLPYAVMVLSILLPYGVIEMPTMIFSNIQLWLFPFWYYGYDLFYEHGGIRILFPFPWYEFPLVILSLMWFVLGLSTSVLLRELYLGRIQRLQVVLLLSGALLSQMLMTSLVLLHVYIYGAFISHMNPLPVHTLLVLLLAAFVPERSAE
jgi:hypothetical protein